MAMLTTSASDLLVLADRTSEKTVIRTVLKVFEKSIGIDRAVAMGVFQQRNMMPECQSMVTRRRPGLYSLLSEESIGTRGIEKDLELIECGNQLFLGDRMSAFRVEIIEDCFQAEITFIDLGDAGMSLL